METTFGVARRPEFGRKEGVPRLCQECPWVPAYKERPLQSKLSARDRLGLRLRRAQNGPPTGRPRTAERPCPREGPLGAAGAGRAAPDG